MAFLSKWRTMRSTTLGSVITAMIFISEPQGHRSGSTSKTFRMSRAQEARLGEAFGEGGSKSGSGSSEKVKRV